jgi:hypothetical protein
MWLLIVILLIPTGDGHGGKAPVVIHQAFVYGMSNAHQQCTKVKQQLENDYGNQVVSSKCVKSY